MTGDASPRVSVSGDVEVGTYLEIAEAEAMAANAQKQAKVLEVLAQLAPRLGLDEGQQRQFAPLMEEIAGEISAHPPATQERLQVLPASQSTRAQSGSGERQAGLQLASRPQPASTGGSPSMIGCKKPKAKASTRVSAPKLAQN